VHVAWRGMSLSLALEPLVPTVSSLVHDALAQGQSRGRGALAYLLRVLPLISRDARDLWRAQPGVAMLLTFCGFLYPNERADRYLDNVLFSDDLKDPDGTIFDTPPKGLLDLSTIHLYRTKLAERMEGGALPTVNDVARNFYHAIWQMHDEFRKHSKYHLHFTECQRVGCTRPAFVTPPPIDASNAEESSEAEYWKCCRDGRSPPPEGSLPSDMSFCCYGCYKVTSAEFKTVVRFDIETPSAGERRTNSRSTYRRRGSSSITPTQLYRVATQRNLAIARQLRDQPQVTTQHYPSTMANREQLVRERTTMLSVDLGLLYVASLLHDAPRRLKPNRPLPNRDNWRDYANCYLNAVCNVRAVYLQYGNGALARDSSELWMRRLRDRMLDIF